MTSLNELHGRVQQRQRRKARGGRHWMGEARKAALEVWCNHCHELVDLLALAENNGVHFFNLHFKCPKCGLWNTEDDE